MDKTKRKCYWCENETDMPYTYHAMGPISEEYELKILKLEKKYGDDWMGREGELEEEIGEQLIKDIMMYDQIINTVSKGVVCADCLDKDDELYNKFRKNE